MDILEPDNWTMTKSYSSAQYVEARRLMGRKDTNQDALSYSIGWGYLHCPRVHEAQWLALIHEWHRRLQLMNR